jgi:thymidylate kinase
MASKRPKLGRLLIVEGPDGVGKSTVCRLLAARLESPGAPCQLLSFPGRQPGTLGELVYRLHHDNAATGVAALSPLANQAMHIAAHMDAIERVIRPLLKSGQSVVLDRFWWSTWVYGVVVGCNRRSLRCLVEAERVAWGRLRPTLAVLLRRPAPIDRDHPAKDWRMLAEEYDRLAARERPRYPVVTIDNVGTPEQTVDNIVARLSPYAARPARAVCDDGQVPSVFPPVATAPTVLTHILPARPTVAYDSYWRFAAERQAIFFRRVRGESPPWTKDEILGTYKFTNAYRASDRVSQYLIRHVIYRDDLPSAAAEVFFRIMLFKLFNKIQTWKLIEDAVGPITLDGYGFARYDRVLSRAMDRGERIYSAAYIMPSGGRTLGHARKHRNHLVLLERMLADSVPQQLADAPSMQRAFTLLKSYPTLGDFLAYQYATDINYSQITNFNENEFVVPGPGALDGIRKVFADTGGLNEAEIIKFVAERQEREFARLGLDFQSLWGRPLQLIDCQNLFCEVDKYSRVRHPELAGISGRLRIKQRFQESPDVLPAPWYPPKWGINDALSHTIADRNKHGSGQLFPLAAE